jgi:orotidine-5'-phosphate decarboxylase
MDEERIRAIADATRRLVAGGKINDAIEKGGTKAITGVGFGLVMADPKLHDIPATIRNRMLAYKGEATFVTVHASNQFAGLKAAAKAANEVGIKAIAVTILTSMSSAECKKIYGRPASAMVKYLATKARRAGLHGIVCSPKEVRMVRQLWPQAIIICPGVRSKGVDAHDQKRIDTPENAILNGADFVVVGREVTSKPSTLDQVTAVEKIQSEIDHVFRLTGQLC